MNIDVPKVKGGIFKKIGDILNDESIGTREERIQVIQNTLGDEIRDANEANIDLAIEISRVLAEKLKDGKIDERSFLHIYHQGVF